MASTRLPGKMLRMIGGKPLILHTLDRARSAASVDRVIVATDDAAIFDAVTAAGGEAAMTDPRHASGSDRVAEVAATLPPGSIVVNVQGDEPLIAPETIDAAVAALIADPQADISTTCEAIASADDLFDPNVVKAAAGTNGYAIYFSRSPLPYLRDAAMRYGGDLRRAVEAEPSLLADHRKHTGLYVYRREFLLGFTRLPQGRLEQLESLEQLRALENGAKIRLIDAAAPSIGVDTEADLVRVEAILAAKAALGG